MTPLAPAQETKLLGIEGPYANMSILPFKTAGVPMAALNAFYGKTYKHLPPALVQSVRMTDYYHTWNDGNPQTDKLKWTCLFCCPYTAEIFVAGQWQGLRLPKPAATATTTTKMATNPLADATSPCEAVASTKSTADVHEEPILATITTPGILPLPRWMPNKKAAQHGAAAWAYDCFHYRLEQAATAQKGGCCTTNLRYVRLGQEDPYLEPCYSLPSFDVDDDTANVWSTMPTGLAHEIATQQALVRARLAAIAARSAESNSIMEEVEQAWQRPTITCAMQVSTISNAVPMDEERMES
jgi:hypothetical protein